MVELNVVEQRYQAVLEVLNHGAWATDVARRHGVSRQTVHAWLGKYASRALARLTDGLAKPLSFPHQMAPEVEARVVTIRREHPGWGQRTILHQLGRDGIEPLPTLLSIYRCLVRQRLITPAARKRKRDDYKRWERSRAMEFWQMDIVGGVKIVDGTEAKIVSGVDDHSRFCISAHVVARATARPPCDALGLTMRRHGVPAEILTDNGLVFAGRFGPGTGEVLSDRICREKGIKHILTRPRSPTTTGKIERGTRRCASSSRTAKCSPTSLTRRPSWMCGSSPTTMSARFNRSGWQHRRTGSHLPATNQHDRPLSRRRILPGRCRLRRTARRREGNDQIRLAQYKVGV